MFYSKQASLFKFEFNLSFNLREALNTAILGVHFVQYSFSYATLAEDNFLHPVQTCGIVCISGIYLVILFHENKH